MFERTREKLKRQQKVTVKYNELINEAENYLENHEQTFSESERIELRQIGMIDYLRETRPAMADKTDEEILAHMDMLEEKFGNDGSVS